MTKKSSNEPDIAGLLGKIQEQLAGLEKKLDALISRPVPPAARPSSPAPVPLQGQGSARPPEPPKRQMFQAVCADCKKDCEVPFKPTGDRPVYCKDCFQRRKSSRSLNVSAEKKPPVPEVVSAAVDLPEPPAKDKKRPAAKRPAKVKKPAAKKKK